MAETTPAVHSVLHAIRILYLYAAQRRESLSLTEICKALGKTLDELFWEP